MKKIAADRNYRMFKRANKKVSNKTLDSILASSTEGEKDNMIRDAAAMLKIPLARMFALVEQRRVYKETGNLLDLEGLEKDYTKNPPKHKHDPNDPFESGRYQGMKRR